MENSPYKFLDFYDIDDQPLFFGREKEINILVADIVVSRLVVLFARTGTGKTSLINAGVRPQLEEQGYSTFYIRVETDPAQAARAALLDFLNKNPELSKKQTSAASLYAELQNKDTQVGLSAQLCAFVESVVQKPIVLFFDQFEEFFLHIKSNRQTRENFIKDIAEVYRDAESGVHLVFSMREEYFHQMDEFREEIPSIFHKNSNLRLLPLDESQAKDAIIKPAATQDVVIDPELADKIIEYLQNSEEGLRAPDLQIICDTLWPTQKAKRITLQDYEELGGGKTILGKRLEQDLKTALAHADPGLISLAYGLMDKLRTEEKTKYPRVFSELVSTLNTNDSDLRDLVSRFKGVQMIKDTIISNAPAIEWASDYLAERTDTLRNLVTVIELKTRLQMAMARAEEAKAKLKQNPEEKAASHGMFLSEDVLRALYPSAEDLANFSQKINYLEGLQTKEVEFLFEAALFHRRFMKEWFDRAVQTEVDPLKILEEKIHDKQAHDRQRRGVIHLLGELDAEQAVGLLAEALEEPDLAREALDILADIPGQPAKDLLAKALNRKDLWPSALASITRTPSDRTVSLLEPFLQNDAKFPEVFAELVRIAKSESLIAAMAERALEPAISHLQPQLEKPEKPDFSMALIKLEDLAGLQGPVGETAQKALEMAVPKLESLLQQKNSFFLALEELERLTKYTRSQTGTLARKAIVSSLPTLEGLIKEDAYALHARSSLERLSKSGDAEIRQAAQSLVKRLESEAAKPRETDTKQSGTNMQPVGTSGSLSRRFAQARERVRKETFTSTGFLEDLMRPISQGAVVPIISNSFRIEHIFREAAAHDTSADAEQYIGSELTIEEQLTELWARQIEYPFPDRHNLVNVAQYFVVEQRSSQLAKAKYVEFLKNVLLNIPEDDPDYQGLADSLLTQIGERRFADLVQELDYPRFPEGMNDPLRLLARLPLPIYVTTSYYNFLERALEMEGKSPRTQVCMWNGPQSSIRREHKPDPDIIPSPIAPVVYHLYGLEDYPETLVLSEDDHLNFLKNMFEDTDSRNPIIPINLRQAFAETPLFFLGYQDRTWIFRALFSVISKFRRTDFSPRSHFVLPSRQAASFGDIERSNQYLARYFDRRQIDMHWETADRFIYELYEEWDKYRRE